MWSGLGNYGDNQNLWLISPFANHQDLYTVRDDLSKAYGSHTFKVGAYLSFNAKNENDYGGGERPSFGTADWALAIPANGGKATGNNLANILLPGQVIANVAERNVTPTAQTRWHDYEFYFGDTWKARRNLTIDYGFRWSFLREPFAANKAISSWDVGHYNPALPASDVCNGLLVVPGTDPCGASGIAGLSKGSPGPNGSLRNNNNHLIAPRVGVIWDPRGDGKTAFRIGAGQFFQRERLSPYLGLAFNTPFTQNITEDRTFASPVTATGGVSSPGLGIDPRGVVPNSWQWNVSVERELLRATTLQLGYVGNRGLHLTSTFDQNSVVPAQRVNAAFQSGQPLNNLRLAPNFGTVARFGRDGASTYHSLQVVFRTKVKEWVNLSAAYTWSHSLANYNLNDSSGGISNAAFSDPFNASLDKGNSTINRPQIFVANAIFYGPQMKDHNAFVKGTLGGWEFTTISTLESGNSNTVFMTGGVSDAAAGGTLQTLAGTGFVQNQRPNVTSVSCNSHAAGAPEEQIYNPAAFTLVGYSLGSISNEHRGYCSGPSNVNADMALYKNWKVAERLGIQFRLEFFNAFNTANFRGDFVNGTYGVANVTCGAAVCSPSNNVITAQAPLNVSNFGQASKTRGPREIQYAIKFTF